jgi:hypothetical protein
MAVNLSAPRTGRTLLPRNILFLMLPVLISVSEPQGLVRPEGLGKLKEFTSSGLEPAIFRLVA